MSSRLLHPGRHQDHTGEARDSAPIPYPEQVNHPARPVADVWQVVTLVRDFLTERIGKLPARLRAAVDAGLKFVLDVP